MTTGLLGGTFDPPHIGHLALAQAVTHLGGVRSVLFIPAHIPPHKERPHLTSAEHRLAMTKLLAEEDECLSVSDIELKREGRSFTIDTIRILREANPEEEFRLIIGADMAIDFHTWRDAEALVKLAPPLVAERPGTTLPSDLVQDGPSGMPENMRRILQEGRFKMSPIDVSSTGIREDLRQGRDVSNDLTAPVVEYIYQHNLYDVG